MEIGTLGEWVGAIATAAATVVALYFGTRDQALSQDRSDARLTIRRKASTDATALRRLLEDLDGVLERDDIGYLSDDVDASEYIALANRLGMMRRLRVRRIVRWIYGNHLVNMADIDPNMSRDDDSLRNGKIIQVIVNGENVNYRTGSRYHKSLVKPVDKEKVRRVLHKFDRLAKL